MMWETSANTISSSTEDCCIDVSECASLITNSFTLSSGGPRPIATSRRPASSSTSTAARHPLAALLQLESNNTDDSLSRSPKRRGGGLFADDFSMYDTENSLQGSGESSANHLQMVSGSPRTTCSAVSEEELDEDEEMVDDDDDEMNLPSADTSPVTFKILQKKPLLRKLQQSFDEATTDSSSMDSGYGASLSRQSSQSSSSSSTSASQLQFRFAQPRGMAPRRLDSGIASPSSSVANQQVAQQNQQQQSQSKKTSFSVFNRCPSTSEEDYMLDMFQLGEEATTPAREINNFSNLISGAIMGTTPDSQQRMMTPRVRRCLNMDESHTPSRSQDEEEENKENNFPGMIVNNKSQSKSAQKQNHQQTTPKRTNLMLLDVNQQQQQPQGKGFKRPEPLMFSPVQSKRYKSEVCFSSGSRTAEPRMERFAFEAVQEVEATSKPVVVAAAQPVLQRAVSLNETMIKNALSRSSSDPDLIGDFSKPFVLPHTEGRHNDLRSISVQTMAELVSGGFDDSVASFKIVDCRYPYEFEGGHIRNAKNLYTQEQILAELVTPIGAGEAQVDAQGQEKKRHILVFHCEFSSERGPKLFRFLRSHDRLCNENSYPALHYPEIYLLDGGYKAFYESYPELCDPINYRQMLDPAYGQEYKTFRAKTKSWNGDNGRATTFKRTKSRSRVML